MDDSFILFWKFVSDDLKEKMILKSSRMFCKFGLKNVCCIKVMKCLIDQQSCKLHCKGDLMEGFLDIFMIMVIKMSTVTLLSFGLS